MQNKKVLMQWKNNKIINEMENNEFENLILEIVRVVFSMV